MKLYKGALVRIVQNWKPFKMVKGGEKGERGETSKDEVLGQTSKILEASSFDF